jgi:hypothetical protein
MLILIEPAFIPLTNPAQECPVTIHTGWAMDQNQ